MSYTEVWVLMVKRTDGLVYCDMHKCYGLRFWQSEHEAAVALSQLDEHIRSSYHVVPVLCTTQRFGTLIGY